MRTILNCAMSADGKIALPTRHQTRISNHEDRERVHLLRNEADAILVGVGTILADDPRLTVKGEFVQHPKMPLRIVLDSRGRTPEKAAVLNGEARTLIATNESCDKTFQGAEVVRFGKERVDLSALISHLDGMDVKTLLVEGGSTVIWSFIKEDLADELRVFVGSMIIGGEGSPTPAGGEGFSRIDDARRLKLFGCAKLGDGALLSYEVVR